ncbi:transposase [Aeribacillus pallidus]|nr:transposase [Aeribacillus pallidus]RZI50421.1 transposase [Aeribacillus pallidus]
MLFRYIEPLFLPETPYVTGQSPVSRRSLLKYFFFKASFAIDSLQQLVNTLHRFRCFRCACGPQQVPHFSTFSRATK